MDLTRLFQSLEFDDGQVNDKLNLLQIAAGLSSLEILNLPGTGIPCYVP